MSHHYEYEKNRDVELVHTGYGKDMVKVLHIQRDGKYHTIKEVTASVQLTLRTKKDYLFGDNSDIIPTDTIKNIVHVLAKFKGIKTIETFAMDICEHFLSSFNHVTRVRVYIEQAPWKRLEKNGKEHFHAFINTPTGTHFCEAEQRPNGSPTVHSGIKDMKVLKTTQSGFEGFIKDQFTTLPEVKDRCFATQVYCKWRYNRFRNVDFQAVWNGVRDIVLEKFAGPFDKGEYSPSIQKTLYDIQVLSVSQNPEIEDMEISLPNIHYFTIDMSKMGLINKDETLLLLSLSLLPICASSSKFYVFLVGVGATKIPEKNRNLTRLAQGRTTRDWKGQGVRSDSLYSLCVTRRSGRNGPRTGMPGSSQSSVEMSSPK
uniref:Uricase n=1 Tax=Phascolarctos cinereus TaxID=38626 RepID=A0A6P5KH57_PHACI|nr:uricase-like isoform X3 [Phascolarctos cinereus]